VINASDLLGAPQIAGVVVSPPGFFRRKESAPGHAFGSPTLGWISNKLAGERGREERRRDADASKNTPECGDYGYLAVTDTDLALTTAEFRKGGAGLKLGQLVTRVPRSTVAQVELAGGSRHPTLYILSPAPLRIAFTDGTAWAFEVNRFSRGRAKRLVRSLQSR
jgi:hypothetical protein